MAIKHKCNDCGLWFKTVYRERDELENLIFICANCGIWRDREALKGAVWEAWRFDEGGKDD